MKKSLIDIAKYAVVVIALGYLYQAGSLRLSDLNIPREGYGWLALGGAFSLLSLMISFVRYWSLLRGAGVDIDLGDALRLGFISTFFNTAVLAGIGGDLVKILYVARETGNRAAAVSTAMMDRILGVMGLLILGAMAFVANWSRVAALPALRHLAFFVFAVLAGIMAGALLAAWFAPLCLPGRILETTLKRLGKPGEALLALIRSVLVFRHRPGLLTASLGLSFVLQAVGVAGLFCLSQALPLEQSPPLALIFMAGPPALIANAIPVPGGGIGVGEAAFDRLLAMCSAPSPLHGGAVIFLLLRVVTLLVGLLGLPLYLLSRSDFEWLQAAAAEA